MISIDSGRISTFVVTAGCLVAVAALPGCSTPADQASASASGSVSSSASPSVSVATTETFCAVAKAWATAPAQAQFRAAVAANDNAAATRALLAWTASTNQLAAALPSEAPEDVKQAFTTFATTIEGAGKGTVNDQDQSVFQNASETVTAYVGSECAGVPSESASNPTQSAVESPKPPAPSDSSAGEGTLAPVPQTSGPEDAATTQAE